VVACEGVCGVSCMVGRDSVYLWSRLLYAMLCCGSLCGRGSCTVALCVVCSSAFVVVCFLIWYSVLCVLGGSYMWLCLLVVWLCVCEVFSRCVVWVCVGHVDGLVWRYVVV